ncbi:MAG: serine/threonine protein kinase, partial [Deltaproteobacteria bacterium]|nr:serine/threonine protein kinase [Deltaproteobacteria bacterium]
MAFGKFEILRKLAVGGMAEIYLSRVHGTAGFEKLVVLKRILPHIAQDPAFVQMFLDEARLAATLQHPNIADVYEVGETHGDVFFTMEYVHGQDVRGLRWASRKRDEQTPLSIALAIIQGLASALDYAHEKCGPDGQPLGLVHRDVSSSNVMISYDGAVKLLDFGIARASTARHKTETGTLKGKIPYMSPEQCRGHRLDRRSDLFSLGIVMFEMTVGRRPFRGTSDFEIMEGIVHLGAPRPSSIVEGYPVELEAIVMKLLARAPVDRYQTAEEMLQDLEPFLAANRLWATPKQIGKYMRLVFSEQIAAWEKSQRDGVPLAQHVVDNPEQEISEIHTPPSAFPGLRSLSQDMPAVARQSSEIGVPNRKTSELGTPVQMTPTALLAAGEPSITGFTKLKLRPSRRLGFVIGGLAVGLIGILVIVLASGGKGGESKPADPTPSKSAVDTKPGDGKQGVDGKQVDGKQVDGKQVDGK